MGFPNKSIVKVIDDKTDCVIGGAYAPGVANGARRKRY